MYTKEEVIESLKERFSDEETLSKIKENLREEYQIGNIEISELVWRLNLDGTNYIIFNNRDQAERIAINVVEKRIRNEDGSLDNDILFKHLNYSNIESITYSKAKKKYEYMDIDDLIRDYRSGLRRDKEYSEHKIYEGRNIAINTYSNELMNKIFDDIQGYFQSEGFYSAIDVTNRYSNFWINSNSAANEIISRRSWGNYLELCEDNMEVLGPGMLLVREWN